MTAKKSAARRVGEPNAATKAAQQRLRAKLRSTELDAEALELIDRLVTKLAHRSPIRRR